MSLFHTFLWFPRLLTTETEAKTMMTISPRLTRYQLENNIFVCISNTI